MSSYNNIAGDVLGSLTGMAVATLFQMDESKKNKELTQQLSNLTATQQEDLNKALSFFKTQTERERYLVEYATRLKTEKLSKERQKKNLFLYIGLGVFGVGTGILFIKLKQKK